MAASLSRIPAQTIAVDRTSFLALQSLSDYAPQNAIYSVATIQQREISLAQASQAVIRLREALDQARRVEDELAHAFHEAMLGARQQVIAQYGPDSAAVEIVGLTRKSDYKHPTQRKPTE
ncbi:MAG: hypothetical protein WCP31_04045 [Chloroflexales bacterium]